MSDNVLHFNDLLQSIKQEYPDKEKIRNLNLLEFLADKKMRIHLSIREAYNILSDGEKEQINIKLWEMTVCNKTDRLKLLSQSSKGYEKFFDWEQLTSPPPC